VCIGNLDLNWSLFGNIDSYLTQYYQVSTNIGINTMTITKLHTDLIEGLDDLMSSGGYIPLEGNI
jgi:hypothetical protein